LGPGEVRSDGIEVSANHDQPAENHTSACLRRPAESKANAAGISPSELKIGETTFSRTPKGMMSE
jgi:hypothetical protein